jgi:hypothetical protein
MAIIHYPGFLTKEEAARNQRVQVRTIDIQINEKRIPFVKLDGITFIRDAALPLASPAGVEWNELQWLRNFARQHHIIADRIYEQIIFEKITGVVIANRIFVMRNEASLVAFAAIAGKSGKKQVFF